MKIKEYVAMYLALFAGGYSAVFLGLGMMQKLVQTGDDEFGLIASWEGLNTRDVTHSLDCSATPYRAAGINYKKICTFEGEEYYLKAATKSSLREAFARKFVKITLGIQVPDTYFFHETNGTVRNCIGLPIQSAHYLASKTIRGFKPALDLQPSLYSFLGLSMKAIIQIGVTILFNILKNMALLDSLSPILFSMILVVMHKIGDTTETA
jgi:hypothetical protein